MGPYVQILMRLYKKLFDYRRKSLAVRAYSIIISIIKKVWKSNDPKKVYIES